MKKSILLLCSIYLLCFGNNLFSQTILNSNFSTYTIGDLSGSNGWSNSTSNPGGTGGCTSVGCLNNRITATAINYPGFGTSTKSISVGPNQDGTGVGFTAVSANSIYVAVVVNFSSVPST
jgi:hypothetical protein